MATPPRTDAPEAAPASRVRVRRGCFYQAFVLLLAFTAVIVITVAVTAWWMNRQFNAQPFDPVALSSNEEAILRDKMQTLEQPETASGAERAAVTITERELNGLLAHNTNLAERIYIELDRDAIRARVNIPVEEDFPMLGGRTIRATLSLGVWLENERLRVEMNDLTVGGFPVPNAWLGGLKGIDLVEHYLADEPAMQAFVAGIEELRLERGRITLVPAP